MSNAKKLGCVGVLFSVTACGAVPHATPLGEGAPPVARQQVAASTYSEPAAPPKAPLDAPSGAAATASPGEAETAPAPSTVATGGEALRSDRAGSLDDASGAELAVLLAQMLIDAPSGDGLPAPRSEKDNNPFALVRPSDELAEDGSQVVVSHDGKRMAFLPSQGGKHLALWVANADGSGARQVVHLETSTATLVDGSVGHIESEAVFSPSFSADGKKLYFQTDGWATSLALYSVDLASGAIRFLADANGYTVIDECRNASLVGSLIAYRHSYSELSGSAADWYFLLSSTGKPRGVVGPSEENVYRYLANQCGAPRPKADPVPRLLTTRPGCNDSVLLYQPKRFLDGTVLPLFYWVGAKDAARPFESLDIEAKGMPLGLDEAKSSLWEQCALE